MTPRLCKHLSSLWHRQTCTLLLALATALLAGTASAGAPDQVTNIFKPLSAPAESVYEISLLALLVCAGIFLVVAGLLVHHHQIPPPGGRRQGAAPDLRQQSNGAGLDGHPDSDRGRAGAGHGAHDRRRAERQPARRRAQSAVVGHQWWWEIRYPDHGVVTANELHLPVSAATSAGRPRSARIGGCRSQLLGAATGGQDRRDPEPPESMWIEP